MIVRHVGNRADLAALCTVSKKFQAAAEKVLYNTLHLRGPENTIAMCDLIANTPRISMFIVALSISTQDEESSDEDDMIVLPANFWQSIAGALSSVTRLRFLSLYLNNIGAEVEQAWILDGCTSQLRSFHCELAWDEHLLGFLRTQARLTDLYLLDFKENLPSTSAGFDSTTLVPRLATLECTFAEAVGMLVPGRPVTRVKTCFSRSRIDEKRQEMNTLFARLRQSKKALRSLDIADSSYSEEISLSLLTAVVNAVSNANELRYLGTLVLPIGGREV